MFVEQCINHSLLVVWLYPTCGMSHIIAVWRWSPQVWTVFREAGAATGFYQYVFEIYPAKAVSSVFYWE